jgi:hypothetical protein
LFKSAFSSGIAHDAKLVLFSFAEERQGKKTFNGIDIIPCQQWALGVRAETHVKGTNRDLNTCAEIVENFEPFRIGISEMPAFDL